MIKILPKSRVVFGRSCWNQFESISNELFNFSVVESGF